MLLLRIGSLLLSLRIWIISLEVWVGFDPFGFDPCFLWRKYCESGWSRVEWNCCFVRVEFCNGRKPYERRMEFGDFEYIVIGNRNCNKNEDKNSPNEDTLQTMVNPDRTLTTITALLRPH